MRSRKCTHMYRSDKEGRPRCRILCQFKKLFMGEDIFSALSIHIEGIPAAKSDCQEGVESAGNPILIMVALTATTKL